jgi:hypothetical protein
VQISGFPIFIKLRDVKILGFIFGGRAKVMDLDFVCRDIRISKSQNVRKPLVAHFIPASFNEKIEIRKVVWTFLINMLNSESRIKLINHFIIPIVLECHDGLHPLSLTGPQCLCHLRISNGFASIPVNKTLMEDRPVLLWKDN